MRLAKRLGVLGLGLVLGVAACGDGGSGGGLSEAEKTELTTALLSTGELGGFGAFAGYAVQATGEVGKLNAAASAAVSRAIEKGLSLATHGVAAASYDGVGFAIDYSYDVGGEVYSGWFMGVVGWSGIDVNAHTVDELVVVGGGSDVGSLPATASGSIGVDTDVFALYWDGVNSFVGTSGSASVTGSSFSGSQDCSASEQGFTVTCEVQVGTMTGDFAFDAEDFSSTSTYTQPPIDFSGLPAVRIVISISGG